MYSNVHGIYSSYMYYITYPSTLPCLHVSTMHRYYEVKLLTDGMMRVGWASPSFPAHLPLGDDEHSYAFDGFLVRQYVYCIYSMTNVYACTYMYMYMYVEQTLAEGMRTVLYVYTVCIHVSSNMYMCRYMYTVRIYMYMHCTCTCTCTYVCVYEFVIAVGV